MREEGAGRDRRRVRGEGPSHGPWGLPLDLTKSCKVYRASARLTTFTSISMQPGIMISLGLLAIWRAHGTLDRSTYELRNHVNKAGTIAAVWSKWLQGKFAGGGHGGWWKEEHLLPVGSGMESLNLCHQTRPQTSNTSCLQEAAYTYWIRIHIF